MLKNLALRQQLAVLKRRHPKPRLDPFDKLFWVVARRSWSKWKDALLLVSPETVVRWHRAGFRLYWAMLCKVRKQVGGKRISKQIRDLIFQMVVENPTWGAPRIHGELLMLGFDVSERTISRWMRRVPRNPAPAKRGFRFFTITAKPWPPWTSLRSPLSPSTCSICFFIISHDRRRILHFNITRHPTSSWIVQQLREAFPYQSAPRLLLFDHDRKYGLEVPAAIRSMAIACVRTSIRSPWHNGVAER